MDNFIGKIVIEDFIPGGDKSKQSNIDLSNIEYCKSQIRINQDLKKAKHRDILIWSKTKQEKIELKKAKSIYKSMMLQKYPDYTNKSDFYTQKALIWR